MLPRLSDFTFTFHFHALEKSMTTHSRVLAWRIPGMGEPGGLHSMGSHRVRHEWSDLAAAAIKRARSHSAPCMLLLLLNRFSRVWLCAAPWTAAHQAPPSMGFSRQEYWSGLPLPSLTPCMMVVYLHWENINYLCEFHALLWRSCWLLKCIPFLLWSHLYSKTLEPS